MDYEVNGTLIQQYYICKREVWLTSRALSGDQDQENLIIGRIIGESAALIYTLGSSTNLPSTLFSSGRTLAVHMYVLANEGFHVNEAYATAVVLLVLVLLLNSISTFISRKLTQGGK